MKKILTTSQWKTKTDRPNLLLEHIAQSRPINGQQEVGSRRRFHYFWTDQGPGLSVKELIDDWLDLTVLEAKKEVQQ